MQLYAESLYKDLIGLASEPMLTFDRPLILLIGVFAKQKSRIRSLILSSRACAIALLSQK